MRCPTCDGELTITHGRHHYTASGLPNVYLHGVETRSCAACGTCDVAIPGLLRLHRALALSFAKKRARLTGAEIRFLRKHLGWSGVDFARSFGVTAETVSRWENEKEQMGAAAERLLRVLSVREQPVESYPNAQLAEVAMTDPVAVSLDATTSRSGWDVIEHPSSAVA
jgi:putative zinc finger/helix-turn-helix YgiT family protein